MKCPNCTKEIPNDSVFCEWCGIKIQDIINLKANEEMVKQFLEKKAVLFPKTKISVISELLLKMSFEQLEGILNLDYKKVYGRAKITRIICGFILQLLTISILIVIYYGSSWYIHADNFVDSIIISAIVGISFLSYMLFPFPQKKVYTLFEKKLQQIM